MDITKVKVHPYKNKSKSGAVGVGIVILDQQLLLSGLELYERNGKRFVKFPKNEFNRRKLCYCQPITSDFNKMVTKALFDAYDECAQVSETIDIPDSYIENAAAEIFNEWERQSLNKQAEMSKEDADSDGDLDNGDTAPNNQSEVVE